MTKTIRTMAKGVWSSKTFPAAFTIVNATFMSSIANAQAVGGGGGSGLLSTFVQWVVTNIAVGAVACQSARKEDPVSAFNWGPSVLWGMCDAR